MTPFQTALIVLLGIAVGSLVVWIGSSIGRRNSRLDRAADQAAAHPSALTHAELVRAARLIDRTSALGYRRGVGRRGR